MSVVTQLQTLLEAWTHACLPDSGILAYIRLTWSGLETELRFVHLPSFFPWLPAPQTGKQCKTAELYLGTVRLVTGDR